MYDTDSGDGGFPPTTRYRYWDELECVWSETWRGGVGEIGAEGRRYGTGEMRVVLFVL